QPSCWHDVINGHILQGIPGHVGKLGIHGILHHGFSPALLDLPEAGRSIVKGPTEDHTDDSRPIREGSRTKQRVDRRPRSIFFGPRAELDMTILDQQMLIRRCYIYMGMSDTIPIYRMAG